MSTKLEQHADGVKEVPSTKVRRKYYLHEEKGGFLEQISGEELDDKLSDKAREVLNYAFYEVELDCEIDTETGKIKILSAK